MKKILMVLTLLMMTVVSVFAKEYIYKLTDFLGVEGKSMVAIPPEEILIILYGKNGYEIIPYEMNFKTDCEMFSKKKRTIDNSFYALDKLPPFLVGVNDCYKYILYEENQYVKVGDVWYTDADRGESIINLSDIVFGDKLNTKVTFFTSNSCSNFDFLNIEKLKENPNKVYTIYSQEKAYTTINGSFVWSGSDTTNGFIKETKDSYTVAIKQGDKISIRIWNK